MSDKSEQSLSRVRIPTHILKKGNERAEGSDSDALRIVSSQSPNHIGKHEESVGYRNPPRRYRFKPGQSGNPKGRPKGAKNESTILRDILLSKISDRNGRRISVLEAILLKMAEGALKGDIRNATFVLNRYAAMISGDLAPSELGEDDREVLEAFARRRMKQQFNS